MSVISVISVKSIPVTLTHKALGSHSTTSRVIHSSTYDPRSGHISKRVICNKSLERVFVVPQVVEARKPLSQIADTRVAVVVDAKDTSTYQSLAPPHELVPDQSSTNLSHAVMHSVGEAASEQIQRFLTFKEVCFLINFKKSFLADAVKNGRFPAPVRMGFSRRSASRFVASEVHAWIAAWISARDSNTPFIYQV